MGEKLQKIIDEVTDSLIDRCLEKLDKELQMEYDKLKSLELAKQDIERKIAELTYSRNYYRRIAKNDLQTR